MTIQVSISMSQLQELVEEVQKTQRSQTLRLTDDVVAVVKPDRHLAPRSASQRADTAPVLRRRPAKAYTLESAYGAIADSGGPRDFDQMIREAKEERADRLLE